MSSEDREKMRSTFNQSKENNLNSSEALADEHKSSSCKKAANA
jgi:hypothetical protein